MNSMARYLVAATLFLSLATRGRTASSADPSPLAAANPKTMVVYVGSYAPKEKDGIHIYRLDMASGQLVRIGAVAGIKNPSFQTLHPNRRFLYSVSESQDHRGQRSGAVSAFAVDPKTGQLRLLNEQPSMGMGPCHVVVDHAGRHVIAANYSSGSVVVLPIRADGSLDMPCALAQHEGSSVHPSRQKQPHAHCVNIDAKDRFVVSADLGIDKVMIYRYDNQNGSITANPHMPAARVKPGAGPRHFAFHPSGRFGYVINELNSTVTAFAYDGKYGTLTPIQDVSTVPADFNEPNTTAEIAISPNGKFLYGSNRGHHSVVVFAIDADSGKLALVSHHSTLGEQPRNFAIDPTGTLLLAANQRTGNVVVFRIDAMSGKLTNTGHAIEMAKPVCITFLPLE